MQTPIRFWPLILAKEMVCVPLPLLPKSHIHPNIHYFYWFVPSLGSGLYFRGEGMNKAWFMDQSPLKVQPASEGFLSAGNRQLFFSCSFSFSVCRTFLKTLARHWQKLLHFTRAGKMRTDFIFIPGT